jgi:hypothetical protein
MWHSVCRRSYLLPSILTFYNDISDNVVSCQFRLFGVSSLSPSLVFVSFLVWTALFLRIGFVFACILEAHLLSVIMSAYSYLFKYIIIGKFSQLSNLLLTEIPFVLGIFAFAHSLVLRGYRCWQVMPPPPIHRPPLSACTSALMIYALHTFAHLQSSKIQPYLLISIEYFAEFCSRFTISPLVLNSALA